MVLDAAVSRTRFTVMDRIQDKLISRHTDQGDPALTYLTDPALAEWPYDYYEQLREQGPFVRGSAASVTVTSRRLAEQLYRDPRSVHIVADPRQPVSGEPLLRRLGRKLLIYNPYEGMMHPIMPPSMIAVNPPDHTRYRKLVTRAFSVKRAEEMRPRIRRIAADLMTAMADSAEPDIMRDFASALPVIVIAEILGVPAADREDFRRWGYAVARTLDVKLSWDETQDASASLRSLNDYFTDIFKQRRAQPQADLVTALLEAEVDGDRLSEEELMANVLILLVAGFETTVNLLGNGANLLMDRPEDVARLHATPELWTNAVDEILRYDSPVQFTDRHAAEDITLEDGTVLAKGSWLFMMLGAANRDPEHFVQPQVFDIERRNARDNMAFSSGIHFCPGAALARIEGQIGLQTLFETYPHLHKRAEGHRRGSPLLRGFDTLPVLLS